MPFGIARGGREQGNTPGRRLGLSRACSSVGSIARAATSPAAGAYRGKKGTWEAKQKAAHFKKCVHQPKKCECPFVDFNEPAWYNRKP